MIMVLDIVVRVTDAAIGTEELFAATSVFLPDKVAEPPVVIVAWPGGGYNRHYFDLHLSGRSGYSEAEDHVASGIIVVCCDHLGTGDSSIPETTLGHAALARINASVAKQLLAQIYNGTLAPGLRRLPEIVAVGVGHSYGALLLTILQAQTRLFNAIALLGWSAVNTVIQCDPSHPRLDDVHVARVPGSEHPYRAAFHWDDLPEDIVTEDLEGYPFRFEGSPVPIWASIYMPGGPNARPEKQPRGSVVAAEAARVDVPILLAVGERDVCPDPWAEPAAYRSSKDISLYIVPTMAHAHNFAGTRRLLWQRIAAWALDVASRTSGTRT